MVKYGFVVEHGRVDKFSASYNFVNVGLLPRSSIDLEAQVQVDLLWAILNRWICG